MALAWDLNIKYNVWQKIYATYCDIGQIPQAILIVELPALDVYEKKNIYSSI